MEGEQSLIKHFHGEIVASWIVNELENFCFGFVFKNTGKWEIGLGKQILRLACLKGKLEVEHWLPPPPSLANLDIILNYYIIKVFLYAWIYLSTK